MNHLTLERVQFTRRSRRSGRAHLTAQLPPGGHGLLVGENSDLGPAISVLSGEKPAHRGRVLLAGRPVLSSPDVRARLGVLPPAADFQALGATAGEHLDAARALRRSSKVHCWDRAQRLDHDLLSRPLGLLTPAERRVLQLEVAFAVREPLALVLGEPLQHLAEPDADWVLTQIENARAAGAVCLFVSANEHRLGPFCEQVLGRPPTPGSDLATLQLRVERPREVAARAQALPCVVATYLDPARDELLHITASDATALSAGIAHIVLTCDCELQEMTWLPKSHRSPGTAAEATPLSAPAGATAPHALAQPAPENPR